MLPSAGSRPGRSKRLGRAVILRILYRTHASVDYDFAVPKGPVYQCLSAHKTPTRYNANMKCAACGDPLPSGKKASARYCDDECRSAAARSRARNRAKRAKQIDSQCDGSTVPDAHRPAKQTRRLRSRNPGTKRTLLARDSVVSVPNDRVYERPTIEQPSSPRIDIKAQVLKQAPPDAVGYGIVLPATSSNARPKIVPRRKKGEQRTPYRLSPFDYPLDIRLRDATWYRILWFGKGGELIPPPPDSGIPSLYFFLGPPEHVAPREIPTRLEPLVLTVDATDSDKPKLLAVSDLVSETREAPVSSPADPVDSAQESPPEPTSAPTFVNEPKDSPHFVPASEKPPQKLHPFWSAEGKCLLHVESLAQLLYEQRAALAKEQGETAPAEPLTQLSGDERKRIRRMARHPAMVQLARMLLEHIASVQSEGIGVLESLPLNIESRSPSEQQLLREAQQHPDKREYLEYLYRRARTLIAGTSPPLEPKNALSTAERKRLTKLVYDLRSMSSMVKLNDGETGAS